jgi:hypothetical protein
MVSRVDGVGVACRRLFFTLQSERRKQGVVLDRRVQEVVGHVAL